MGNGPFLPVGGPPAVPPRVGLLVSAVDPQRLEGWNERWVSGFKFEPEDGDAVEIQDPCGRTAVVPAAALADPVGTSDDTGWEPYEVIASYTCSSHAFNSHDWEAVVRRRLAAGLEQAVSGELWTGDLATASGWNNLFLASTRSDDVTEGVGVPTTEALACLQQCLSESNGGQRGFIHATRQTITHWTSLNLLRREGQVIFDLFDNIVVPGAGYDGSTPDGAAASDGDVWAYATGPVYVALGDVDVDARPGTQDTTDFTADDVEVFASQPALAFWDGTVHCAVRIDLDVCQTGGS